MYSQPYYQVPKRGFPWVPVLLIVGGVILAGILACGALIWYAVQEPEGISVEILADDWAIVGETIVVEVVVKNISTGRQRIESVDFENALLEAMSVVSSDPPWRRVEPVPFIGTSYQFRRTLAPSEELSIKFEVTIEQAGHFWGTVDVYVGVGLQSIMTDLEIVIVTPEEAAQYEQETQPGG